MADQVPNVRISWCGVDMASGESRPLVVVHPASALNRFADVIKKVVRDTDHIPYDPNETFGVAKNHCILEMAEELYQLHQHLPELGVFMSPPPLTAATPQPPPQPGGVEIAPLVLADIRARVEAGERKYGTKLQAHNGRDALVDAYQEALDMVMYLRQAIEERAVRP